MHGDPEYLTASDAATILHITAQSVRVAANTGRLKVASKTAGGWRLFLRSDVEEFAKTRKARS